MVPTNYKISPVSAGGLEIRLLLSFSVEQKRNPKLMKDFFGNLYDSNYCAQKVNNDQTDDDSDNEIIVSVECENVY